MKYGNGEVKGVKVGIRKEEEKKFMKGSHQGNQKKIWDEVEKRKKKKEKQEIKRIINKGE